MPQVILNTDLNFSLENHVQTLLEGVVIYVLRVPSSVQKSGKANGNLGEVLKRMQKIGNERVLFFSFIVFTFI